MNAYLSTAINNNRDGSLPHPIFVQNRKDLAESKCSFTRPARGVRQKQPVGIVLAVASFLWADSTIYQCGRKRHAKRFSLLQVARSPASATPRCSGSRRLRRTTPGTDREASHKFPSACHDGLRAAGKCHTAGHQRDRTGEGTQKSLHVSGAGQPVQAPRTCRFTESTPRLSTRRMNVGHKPGRRGPEHPDTNAPRYPSVRRNAHAHREARAQRGCEFKRKCISNPNSRMVRVCELASPVLKERR